MRAKEFIFEQEGKIRKRHAAVQKGIIRSRDKGGFDRTYHANRMGMALAKADGRSHKPVDSPESSWNEKYNTYHPYTQEEWNMIKQAEATVPTDSKEMNPWSKSEEPKSTHKVSPVSNWNKNNE